MSSCYADFDTLLLPSLQNSTARLTGRSQMPNHSYALKDKSGVDKIIVKKQPYQLLSTSREFFPSFDASNFHKLV